MTKNKNLIIMLSAFLAILLCSIAFGVAIACVKPQKPIMTLDITLSEALKNGTAENYDYFTKKELFTGESAEDLGHKISQYDFRVILIEDNSMTNGFKIDLWYCNYFLKDDNLAMCKLKDIDIGPYNDIEGNKFYFPTIRSKKPAKIYYLSTHEQGEMMKYIESSYYFTVTANAETMATLTATEEETY